VSLEAFTSPDGSVHFIRTSPTPAVPRSLACGFVAAAEQ
jgi:hypothetical protein